MGEWDWHKANIKGVGVVCIGELPQKRLLTYCILSRNDNTWEGFYNISGPQQ